MLHTPEIERKDKNTSFTCLDIRLPMCPPIMLAFVEHNRTCIYCRWEVNRRYRFTATCAAEDVFARPEISALTMLRRNRNVKLQRWIELVVVARQLFIAVPDFFDQLVRKEATIVGFSATAYAARLKSACGQLAKWIAEVRRRPRFSLHPDSYCRVRLVDCPRSRENSTYARPFTEDSTSFRRRL